MRKLATALLLLLLAGWAEAVTPTIKVLFVYSPNATAEMTKEWASAGDPATSTQVEIDTLNEAFKDSGVDVEFASAGILFNATHDSVSFQSSVNVAATDPTVMAARDATGADITVLVGQWPNATIGGQAHTICADAFSGIVAVSVSQLAQSVTAHEIGHLLCATHARAVIRKSGNTQQDCKVTYSLMVNPLDKTMFHWFWQVVGGGFQHTGRGDTADQANADFGGQCPFYDGVYWSYQCIPIPPCSVPPPGPGANGSCTFTRIQDYHNPDNGDTRHYQDTPAISASYQNEQFTCQKLESAPFFEGPNMMYGGLPLGDATHDNITAIKNKVVEASGWHVTKIRPTLPP